MNQTSQQQSSSKGMLLNEALCPIHSSPEASGSK
jgi:hypothetical protein